MFCEKEDCLVYLTDNTTPSLTAHPARGAFGIQSNICGGAFFVEIINVLRQLAIIGEELHCGCLTVF